MTDLYPIIEKSMMDGSVQAYKDMYALLRDEKSKKTRHYWCEVLSREAAKHLSLSPSVMYEVYKVALKLDAYDYFDAYMLFLESNRLPKDRFYQPRRKILKKAVDAIQELIDGDIDEMFIQMPPRCGKALANDTPILTRKGWKKHGDLVVGDEVIGMDGEFKKVLAVHPKCQLDRLVKFSNGEEMVCHFRHEWLLYDRCKGKMTLEETQYYEMRQFESNVKGRGHRYHLQLPTTEPILGEEKALPLDPYTLGVWLGDGANMNPRISNAREDKAIIDKIVSNGIPVRWHTVHESTGVDYYDFDIRKELRSFGMCHSRKRTEKHIPEEYLTASIEQRLELLAGLIDTDGTKNGKQYVYTTADEKLKDTFCELISTFGWRYGVTTIEPKESTSGIVGKRAYWVVKFTPHLFVPCVLERKQIHEFGVRRKIAMVGITKTKPQEGNCITVEGGMYLAGKTMIPTHNTTLCVFLMSWLMGREPNRTNLYSAFSDTITSAFYDGVMEILTDPDTYLWNEVFPTAKVAHTNAKEEMVNIDRNTRYATLTARSIRGTLNGACDCNNLLLTDDLIGGIEEVLNPQRLDSTWNLVDNNLMTRAKGQAKRLWVGTRWSLMDPAGRRMRLLEDDPHFSNWKYKVIILPALDDHDESNFDYDFGVGFTTEQFHRIRASFEHNGDLASWQALYQQTPIEREGTIFAPEGFRYFNSILPEEPVSKIFMAVDPAFGGGDFVAGPVCVKTPSGIYIPAVIYDDREKDKTIPHLIDIVVKYGVRQIQFGVNKMTKAYKDEFERLMRERYPGHNVSITTKADTSLTSKNDKIMNMAPNIRDTMVFLDSMYRDKEYTMFMQNVFSFSLFRSKKAHDDAPDSLAMAMEYELNPWGAYKIINRPF